MDKVELKAKLEEDLAKWLESLDNEEYKSMDEFMFVVKVIRCECGKIHFLRVLREYGGDVECDPLVECEEIG